MFDYLDLVLFILNFLAGYFGYRKGKKNIPEAEVIAKELSEVVVKAAEDRKITASELKEIAKKAKQLEAKLKD